MGQPLDKRKVAFYGLFVQAAYAMYHDPQSSDPLRPEPKDIPAGYELEAWIHMSDFIFDIALPKFYGIVVHRVDEPNSRIIAIRGTEGALEWIDDAAAIPVPFREVPSAGRVAFGFDNIYNTMKVVKRTLRGRPTGAEDVSETFRGSFAEQLEQLAISLEVESELAPRSAEGRARPKRPTIVAGHSLGAALATLFVMENGAKGTSFDVSLLCTFASPRVGNMEFVHLFNQLPVDSWRIVNLRDIVPKFPPHVPIVLDYGHVDVAVPFNSSDFAKNNLVCWHKMDTYLHWLDSSFQLLPECVLENLSNSPNS